MITEVIKKTGGFKLQEKTCPDCGEETIDDVCPVCNPEETGETDTDLDEEALE